MATEQYDCSRDSKPLPAPNLRAELGKAMDLDAANHWRELAAEARAVADELTDPEAKLMMLVIAQGYERLAEHADKRDKPENHK